MILFTILTLIVIALIIFTILTISLIGAAGIIVCGDIIVCVIFLILFIRFLWRRRR